MNDYLFYAAALASHVKLLGSGFRQKDVRFMLELMSSWHMTPEARQALPLLHNTQILRRMDELVHLGWMRRLGKRTPHYRLTRSGLVGILSSLRDRALRGDIENYVFIHYLLQSYRERLTKLIEQEGLSLPLPQKMEVEEILDGKKMAQEKLRVLQNKLNYWQRRVNENQQIINIVQEQLALRTPLDKIVSQIEKRFPYELNYQKPLTHFIAEIPEELKGWELTEGHRRRALYVWENFIASVKAEMSLVLRLADAQAKNKPY